MSNNESNQYRIKRLSLSTIGEMLRERLGSNANSYKFPDDFERAVEDIGFSAAVYDGESSPYDVIFIGDAANRSVRYGGAGTVTFKKYKTVTFIGATSIPSRLFYGQNELTNVIFNEGIVSISISAFENCALEQNIVLPSTLTTIGLSAFTISNITGISGVNVNNLVCDASTVKNGVFKNCSNLKTAIFPKVTTCFGDTTDRGVFLGCVSLETVQLGSVGYPVTSIGSYSFYNCTNNNLEITIYTSASYINTAITNTRNGATNATIIIKAASDLTYDGVNYDAGDTVITSIPS